MPLSIHLKQYHYTIQEAKNPNTNCHDWYIRFQDLGASHIITLANKISLNSAIAFVKSDAFDKGLTYADVKITAIDRNDKVQVILGD